MINFFSTNLLLLRSIDIDILLLVICIKRESEEAKLNLNIKQIYKHQQAITIYFSPDPLIEGSLPRRGNRLVEGLPTNSSCPFGA